MSSSTLLSTFSGAFQGSISVLLTLLAGYAMGSRGYLNRTTVKHVSHLCTTLFLPCLIVESMGPELTAHQISLDWIVPLWGLASTLVAHGIGYIGRRALHLPYWTVVACGRPNSNVLPLLLLQSLEHTGVLDDLARPGESVKDTLDRAKSLVLLNAIVQQSVTFQFAPSIMRRDSRNHNKRDDSGDPEAQHRPRPGQGRLTPPVQNSEQVGLLEDCDHDEGSSQGEAEAHDDDSRRPLEQTAHRPDVHWPHRLRPLEKLMKVAASYISPPFLGAIVALVIGITPPLHHAILDEDGVLYSSITQTMINLGELFVALQAFNVGAELALVRSSHPGAVATSWVLFVRFVIMPILGLFCVWLTAGRGLYVDDRLVWFLLVLIPSGPSAMLLVSVAELVNVDQGAIAGYLTIAYLLSPLMAVVCSLGLLVVENVAKRTPTP